METYLDIIVESMLSELKPQHKAALIGGAIGGVVGGTVGHLTAKKLCRKKWGTNEVGYKACMRRAWFGPFAKKEPEQKKK